MWRQQREVVTRENMLTATGNQKRREILSQSHQRKCYLARIQILDFQPLLLNHPIFGHLLEQLQETNTCYYICLPLKTQNLPSKDMVVHKYTPGTPTLTTLKKPFISKGKRKTGHPRGHLYSSFISLLFFQVCTEQTFLSPLPNLMFLIFLISGILVSTYCIFLWFSF